MEKQFFVRLISRKVPESALAYCIQLFEEAPFHFKVSKKRATKLGDYRFDPRAKSHTITVNEDLHPFQFLITYIHEVAHRRVHEQHRKQAPHGPHWKNEFRTLMLPLLRPEVFPEPVLRALAKHMKNPKASAAADITLVNALRKFDDDSGGITLAQLAINEEFSFRGRSFRKLEVKRTRALCLDLKDQKRYLVPLMVEIE